MSKDAQTVLERGSELIRPLLLRHGFAYRRLDSGESSGGRFASAEFKRESRRLEYHFRDSLGMVSYHIDSHSMSHQEYMSSVLRNLNASHYPGFSSDPLDGFRHLLLDLEEHCVEFLEGSDEVLRQRVEDALRKSHIIPGIQG
ncbi:hypothetical protein P8935_13990 [Telmatobacter sp. DSM 110680]|uniref:Uncharacterized protein n=1 Tax=Telmatobacter sp. DSM 110680 TaxID=3036704 RepID=A0AAU7DEB8_9BACT